MYSQKNAFVPMIQKIALNSLSLGLDQEIIIGSDLGLKSLQPNMEVLSFMLKWRLRFRIMIRRVLC